ncbi:related to molybdopterin synthase large subunit [Sporisorium reilianum f. sp. reilianum]|uniref:Related to molybdopterin synthase large subunit n=1 Tax=Sporisorium reilianum f. sp. reilianum TaxID=72559 RepID=A0A2N8UC38_9BASI|nr:related to molybdopterin synthase large subunit [Sporisorium reilianum f. sp. reilianum]
MTSSSPQGAGPSSAPEHPPAPTTSSIKSQHGDEAVLTYDVLDEKEAVSFVADNGAGATVLFSGTTRDSFRGKQVTRLEYEAYTSLALKTLQTLLSQAHTSAPFADNPTPLSANADPSSAANEDRVTRCYVAHRLGAVGVGECSILIAVSSPHRKEAFVVAEWLLEEVKKNVAVWKREFYAAGDSVTALDGEAGPFDPKQSGAVDAEVAKETQGWEWKANFPTT